MSKKYEYDSKENREYLARLRNELLEFGKAFPSEGGSSYYLGDDGTPWKDRKRETWITSRMTHVYSIGSFLGFADGKKLAAEGIKGLTGELHDKKSGGWYAGLTPDGSIVPDKQCYAHAFVILASSSAMLAGIEGADRLLEDALEVYDRYFWNEAEGLACDTWNTDFTELDPYRGINANMHTVEAFLAVYDATGRETYRERAGRIIGHVTGWAKDNNYRIPEHFTADWRADLECNREKPDDPFKPYGATPGHGIEWARLIVQWASSMAACGDFDPTYYIGEAEKLYCRAVDDAWNADGAPGIVYTTDWNGKPVVHDRMHWTLAEAINTSAALIRLTGKERYRNDYYAFMEYLDKTVHDPVNGSWFHQLDAENKLLATVWPGKSDLYHAFQATLIPYAPVEISVAAAVRTMRKYDVVALGELLIDFTENGINEAGNPVLTANPGGAPCNVLAMLQKLGKKTAFIGKVGKDAFGDFLKQTIEEQGICADNLLQDETVPTTLAFVHTAPDGDRSFSFYRNPGADMMLRTRDIDFSLIDASKVFHFGTLSMTDTEVEQATKAALGYAKSKGKLISFDPNLRPLLWDNPEHARRMMICGIENCDILKIADDEIMFITGCKTVEEAIDEFLKIYRVKLVCVTLGRDGSIALYNGKRIKAAPFILENTIETTGAGDTFMACVINYCLENGIDGLADSQILEMLTFANAAAAIITTRKGALKVMPDREEISGIYKLISLGGCCEL